MNILTPRTEKVLDFIIAQYITRGMPVSSQSVTEERGLEVSSATIRNDMARLEDEGYLTRPYPSSGSIPTDKGYRYYVEKLTDIELPPDEQRLISHLFHQVENDLEEWLRLAVTLAARLVQNVAIATTPKPASCHFKHLELVALRDLLALAVLVLRGARVKQQLIIFDQAITQSELTTTANKLNQVYADLAKPQIQAKATNLSPVEQQVADCVVKMMQTVDEQEYDETFLDGWHFILNQPDLAPIHQAAALMELMEQRSLLRVITPPQTHKLSGKGVQVIIGKENKAEIVQNYSVVIRQYGLPSEAVGTIGVIGPTRMHYARAISTINYLSLVLDRLMAELYGGRASARQAKRNAI